MKTDDVALTTTGLFCARDEGGYDGGGFGGNFKHTLVDGAPVQWLDGTKVIHNDVRRVCRVFVQCHEVGQLQVTQQDK